MGDAALTRCIFGPTPEKRNPSMPHPGPLRDCRVLELGTMIAGPFAGRLLADFGAEVIKVEPPDGDPIRDYGDQFEGKSLYWASVSRNKRVRST